MHMKLDPFVWFLCDFAKKRGFEELATISARLLLFLGSKCLVMFKFDHFIVATTFVNFQEMNKNRLECELCKQEPDTQEHALCCPVVHQHVKIEEGIKYGDLFSSPEKQLRVTKIYNQIIELRERLQEPAYRGDEIPDHQAL